jgi:serine/threonine protein kinase
LLFIGAFGNVKLAILKKDKTKKFALKAMKKIDIIQSKHVDHIENEKKILEMLNHPFIVSNLHLFFIHLSL